MKITFWGAARQVTGSMFLLELADDYRILIDCGLDMVREREARQEPERSGYQPLFPFEASMINVVLLTHAHIDHSGNIPNLMEEGFEGQVLCTAPTEALAHLLLLDSANLHLRKIKALQGGKRRRGGRRPGMNTEGLYLERQVQAAMEQFVTVAFNRKFRLNNQVSVTFIPTGHLLGAANILLEITENGQTKTIGFSGDLGRKNYPLLPDPDPFPEVDYLVCESTYGNRRHRDAGDPEDILADIIQRACVDIPGRLLIPAFSVGRTQALLYVLNKLYLKRQFDRIPIFSDSPLALRSTEVYENFQHLLNAEAREFRADHQELFDFSSLQYVKSLKESRAVSNHGQPCIIVSSSGMVRGGRIEQHMEVNLQNPYCTILMIGFAAPGTVGHQLMMGEKEVRLRGKAYEVLARVERTDIFSGHGDLDDLLQFIAFQRPERLQRLFLVHGEYPSMVEFREALSANGFDRVEIPARGETFEL